MRAIAASLIGTDIQVGSRAPRRIDHPLNEAITTRTISVVTRRPRTIARRSRTRNGVK